MNPDANVEIIDSDGIASLSAGNNYYTIRVTSANGLKTKEYILNVYRKYPITTAVASSAFQSGYSYSFSSVSGSPGYEYRCTYSTSGTKISLYAAAWDAGGNDAAYHLTANYNIKGASIVGMGQTVIITTKCTTSIAGAHSITLKAGSTSLGTICKNRTGTATTYEYTMPNDGKTYTLNVSAYANAVIPNPNTVNVTITDLYIE